MYKRMAVMTVLIVLGFLLLCGLGLYSLKVQADGLAGRRLGEFVSVAEQVRRDVKRKLDDFMRDEQNRDVGDYLDFALGGNVSVERIREPGESELRNKIESGMARGYFQVPYDSRAAERFFGSRIAGLEYDRRPLREDRPLEGEYFFKRDGSRRAGAGEVSEDKIKPSIAKEITDDKKKDVWGLDADEDLAFKYAENTDSSKRGAKAKVSNRAEYQIDSFVNQTQQQAKVMEEKEPARSSIDAPGMGGYKSVEQQRQQMAMPRSRLLTSQRADNAREVIERIEPLTPVLLPDGDGGHVFGADVYLVRHVQVGDEHFIQGFELDGERLEGEIIDSVGRFIRDDMRYELSNSYDGGAAYTAVLDFGFGEVALNLYDKNSDWLAMQVRQMRNWYLGIIGGVLLLMVAGLVTLWRNVHSQLMLARKKDDFISAVSHELRTPLTGIRMYIEMLEKGWLKDEGKRGEYYANIRQESERLSRLIENVLDFSRIQRGRKRFDLRMGDPNECVAEAVKAMMPYADRNGFKIETEFGDTGRVSFDRDALMQIVINLVDNAVKYGRGEDKRVFVRTLADGGHFIVEVEDRGPGVPYRQREKIFEQFYRMGEEDRREAAGTGLGLALVRQFAGAHKGFVEVLNGKPCGALFRVYLSIG